MSTKALLLAASLLILTQFVAAEVDEFNVDMEDDVVAGDVLTGLVELYQSGGDSEYFFVLTLSNSSLDWTGNEVEEIELGISDSDYGCGDIEISNTSTFSSYRCKEAISLSEGRNEIEFNARTNSYLSDNRINFTVLLERPDGGEEASYSSMASINTTRREVGLIQRFRTYLLNVVAGLFSRL